MRKIDYFSLILACNVASEHTALGSKLSRSVSFVKNGEGKETTASKISLGDNKDILLIGIGKEKISPGDVKKSRKVAKKKLRKKKENSSFKIDPATGIKYRVIKRGKEGNGKAIIKQVDPAGDVFEWVRLFPEAELAFSNENLAKSLEEEEEEEEEDFLKSVEENLRKAISKQNLHVVRNLLKAIPNPEAFIARFPDLLREAQENLEQVGAGKKIRRIIVNLLLGFGYTLKVD
ncbi:MAG: hypothetical protein LBJ81_00250 [Puniceicoccales bacterium]|jgi:hypothetical protein|nr:hypothetical protein [Puniceicoccales bacterium]